MLKKVVGEKEEEKTIDKIKEFLSRRRIEKYL